MDVIGVQVHLIITDPWLARKQPIHLTGWHLAGLAVAATLSLILAALLTYHALFVYGARQGWPVITPIVQMIASKERESQERYLKENLDVMARKLGEMQARLVQLDSLGERVSSLAGLPPESFKASGAAGGALVSPQTMSLATVGEAIRALENHAEVQFTGLSDIEAKLFGDKIKASMLPTAEPVPGVTTGSGFGWRVDPLTGQRAMHTGLDFPADTGTPILSAAGGVVVVSEFHPAYGHMVEIDHGNELITRYAHASRVLVKRGDIVKRGQWIADVGNSGRSTGPHLHFEVWLAGVAQNPQTFLTAGAQAAKVAQLSAAAPVTKSAGAQSGR